MGGLSQVNTLLSVSYGLSARYSRGVMEKVDLDMFLEVLGNEAQRQFEERTISQRELSALRLALDIVRVLLRR